MPYTSSSLSTICETGSYGLSIKEISCSTFQWPDYTFPKCHFGIICKGAADLKCPLVRRDVPFLHPFPSKCTKFWGLLWHLCCNMMGITLLGILLSLKGLSGKLKAGRSVGVDCIKLTGSRWCSWLCMAGWQCVSTLQPSHMLTSVILAQILQISSPSWNMRRVAFRSNFCTTRSWTHVYILTWELCLHLWKKGVMLAPSSLLC